ncbi:unnamed protein product, partial [Phaeothamnion confervicola]
FAACSRGNRPWCNRVDLSTWTGRKRECVGFWKPAVPASYLLFNVSVALPCLQEARHGSLDAVCKQSSCLIEPHNVVISLILAFRFSDGLSTCIPFFRPPHDTTVETYQPFQQHRRSTFC